MKNTERVRARFREGKIECVRDNVRERERFSERERERETDRLTS